MTTTSSPLSLPQSNGWTSFDVDGFAVEAKVYDEGSHFGIGFDRLAENPEATGRISKLNIRRLSDRVEVFNYDRGLDHWDRQALHPLLLDAIVRMIEGAEFTQVRRLVRRSVEADLLND